MITKLRIKLVALSMSLLLLLLAIILTAVNILNFHSVVSFSDSVLDLLADNDGVFPERLEGQRPPDKPHGFSPEFSIELPYESRYFTVRLDKEGEVTLIDTGKIAAVDSSNAIAYAMEVWERGNERGFTGDYRYRVKDDGIGYMIVFLDCGRRLEDFRYFMFISGIITLIGYIIVFLLILFLSGKIVKPFIDNYEKQKLFITDAGHELKTPLTIIDADTEVLESDIGENEWLTDIRHQTGRLASLTNALITLSRMEEGGRDTEMIDFPFSDVTVETAHSFQSLAMSQNKTLTLDIQPMISFKGDEKALRQLVSILLDNAVKYCGEKGKILLSLKRSGKNIRLIVKNTSEPLPEEKLKHLFDRFYRADSSRSSETGGYGIGLSIAKAIVSAHKGNISASCDETGYMNITAIFSA